ncbi:MAG: DUF4276 family protein [Ignavibacteriales bacterium]|jgi:hypothetical protein|nr:DUF4276 family protein [Ignavibacteriales bacterium]MBP9124071.1 DUF4276 family protein [Ignavibacteriaceae bacterium]
MGEKCSWGKTMSGYKRLNIIVEGETEERFVNNTVTPYLGNFSIVTSVRKVESGRKKSKIFRGGLFNYEKAKGDITKWMREDQNPEVYFTTMFDLYALPENFPGQTLAHNIKDPYAKIDYLESEFSKDIADKSFIPYIQLHEFESLLFVQPAQLGNILFEAQNSVSELEKIADEFGGNPELIDEGKTTAPSKRIIKILPKYKSQKPTAGASAAGNTGIPLLKERCKHFRAWITKLEGLGTTPN